MLRFLPYHLRKGSINIKRKPRFSNHRSFWYIFFIIPKVNCSIIGCSNSTYKINKWKKRNLHRTHPWGWTAETKSKKKGDCLEYKPPFHLHTHFFWPIKFKQRREAWLKAVRGEPFDKKGSWKTAPSGRPHKKINRF